MPFYQPHTHTNAHCALHICVSLPVVYVVLSEIFPMGVRGRAVSVVSAVNWATNLLISMTFLTFTGLLTSLRFYESETCISGGVI